MGSRQTEIGAGRSHSPVRNSVELFARTDTPNCRSPVRYGLNRVKSSERNETISGKTVGTAVRPYRCVAEHSVIRVRQQLILNYRDLSVDHSIKVQLTTTVEGKVLRRIRE